MSIKVFTTTELLNAVNADASKVLQIVRKKEPKKINGTEFYDARWSLAGLTNKEGWFTAENIELSDGIADPENKLDVRNSYNKEDGTSKLRLQLQTSLSRSGDLGKALRIIDDQFKDSVEKLIASKQMVNRKLHRLFQYKLSEENPKNPGGEIEDPILRFQVDFTNFSSKYPHNFLQNQPKTVFYDARTEYIKDGKTLYKEAEVEIDGKSVKVTDKNVHLFVTKGSKIVSIRFMMPSVPVSQNWISMPIVANKVVIAPAEPGGFSDEVSDATTDAGAEDAAGTATTGTPSAEDAAAADTTNTVPVQDAFDDLMNDLSA